jgi:hypothetical protein
MKMRAQIVSIAWSDVRGLNRIRNFLSLYFKVKGRDSTDCVTRRQPIWLRWLSLVVASP